MPPIAATAAIWPVKRVASASVLYTPEVLGLATSLARFPMGEGLSAIGEARSASCGSTLKVGLVLDETGAITRVGLAAHACAVGQAAAAVFAAGAVACRESDIAAAEQAIAAWLAAATAETPVNLPQWPGLAAIAAAAAYPARHGAILLGWRAALAAFTGADAQTQSAL